MNLTELEIVKKNVIGQLESKEIAPICLSGKPGTGKSSVVYALAKALDMNLVDVSGSSVTIEFMSGLPNDERTPHLDQYALTLGETRATKWSIPEILLLANTNAQSKPTILLLDDFHLANSSVQPYFFKLLLQRQLGDFKLDHNVAIVLTINDSDSASFNGFNSALRNRMSILPVEFNFDYWFDNFGRYIDYRVSSFLKAKPHHVLEEESTGIEGYASARAWTSISKELKNHDKEFVLAHANKLAGMQVSIETANAFHKHVQFINSVDFDSVVRNRTMVDISSKEMIEQFTYQYISNFINTIEDGKYLLELCDMNYTNDSFIGFLLGDISFKYTQNEDLTDGLRFVVDILVDEKPVASNYKDAKQAKLDKIAKDTSFKHGDSILSLASKYLI